MEAVVVAGAVDAEKAGAEALLGIPKSELCGRVGAGGAASRAAMRESMRATRGVRTDTSWPMPSTLVINLESMTPSSSIVSGGFGSRVVLLSSPGISGTKLVGPLVLPELLLRL